jgi:hypothetical protein
LTTTGLWDELGIAPCRDPKAIRRAYAARLRQLDPDRNPDAFARLRRAFERALRRAASDEAPPRAGLDGDDPLQKLTGELTDASTDESSEAADEVAGWDNARRAARPEAQADLQPAALAIDRDDIRDRGLLVTLDDALQQRDAKVAMALYYRAAARGALSLRGAAGLIERMLAVAVDDLTLSAAALRDLIKALGLDAARSQALIDGELRRRLLARLAAEDWYDNLLVTAQNRKGAVALARAKIARLLLGRIGRFGNRGVHKTALRSWLAQYKPHAAWLEIRINPAWPKKLERRLHRREMFGLALLVLFVGNALIQILVLFAVSLLEGDTDPWAVAFGAPIFGFVVWIFVRLANKLIKLACPGFRGFSHIVPPRLWTRIRTIWKRSKAPETGDVG